ncbi:hypothetical protein B5E82_14130 [Lachnoclostridium sp. An138]|nr:hypothetical protein B5E82_14130 [Lachnoclostridium sp. An138]
MWQMPQTSRGRAQRRFFAPGCISGFLKQNYFRSQKFCGFGTEGFPEPEVLRFRNRTYGGK